MDSPYRDPAPPTPDDEEAVHRYAEARRSREHFSRIRGALVRLFLVAAVVALALRGASGWYASMQHVFNGAATVSFCVGACVVLEELFLLRDQRRCWRALSPRSRRRIGPEHHPHRHT